MTPSPRRPLWRDPAAPYVIAFIGIVSLFSSIQISEKAEANRSQLEDQAATAQGQLAGLQTQTAQLRAQLASVQRENQSRQAQLSALNTQLDRLKQDQTKTLAAQREQLQRQFGRQLAQKQTELDAAVSRVPISEPASTELPQTDAGMVPADDVAAATPQDQFEQRCLDAIQAYFNGAAVNQTPGGMTSATPWIEGSPYWFWNVNIRVSGTEHVEPFKCRSSRDTDFELLQGW